jgi:ferredoxin-NADP reductase
VATEKAPKTCQVLLTRHFCAILEHMQTYILHLKDKREIADQTIDFVFERPEGFSFQAGQYIAMTLPHLDFTDTKGPTRCLSIASAPCEEDLHFAMRITNSAFKQTLSQLSVGSEVKIGQPVGHFVLPQEDDRPVFFLIGGIGITPARSMLVQANHEGRKQPFRLFYSNRRVKDISFFEELRDFPALDYRCINIVTEEDEAIEPDMERGFIRAEIVQKHLDNMEKPFFYLVGGLGFLQAMGQMLKEIQVPAEDIKKDAFTGL